MLVILLISVILTVAATARSLEDEPKCTSFDYDKRSLELLVRLELEMDELKTKLATKEEMNAVKASMEKRLEKSTDKMKHNSQEMEATMINRLEETINALNKTMETPASSPSCACPDEWTVYRKSCYLFGHHPLSFSGAEGFCEYRHSHLVRIDDEEENRFIKRYLVPLKVGKHWIGLTDEENEGSWKWQDTGSLATYFNWNRGQPNQGRVSNCAAIWDGRYGHNWVDEPCKNLFQPVCEQPCL